MAEHTPAQPLPPIRFAELAAALLARATTLVPAWLPGGAQRGHEYVCGSLSGGQGSSCSVNLSTGKWADFAADVAGNDLVGLYAAIHDLPMGKAAVQLAREEGLEDVAGVQPAREGAAPAPKPPRPAPPPAPAPKQDEGWCTVVPVPEFAPAATFKHQFRKPEEIEHTAVYQIDGALYGYVVRFRTSDGGKETLPYAWCTSARDGASRWHWKQWDEPRPLYFPGGLSPLAYGLHHQLAAPAPLPTVVLVEGEKKAGILQALLDAHASGVYLVCSWSGGCKAWKKADWSWLNGCTVLLWPDCDGKREPLTKKEREACLDDAARDIAQAMKPLLSADKQPGMAAMLGIGALLRSAHACTVQLLPIPEPLTVPDGWDCADAISTDGWDGARVLAFFGRAQPLLAGSGAGPQAEPGGSDGGGGKNRDRPVSTGGGEDGVGGDSDAFQGHLDFMCAKLKCEVRDLGVNRKLLITALRKAPGLKDCLGLNELTGAPSTQVPWPWRAEPGPLAETDDLRLGDYLCQKYGVKAASRAALAEAIDTVADERRFHPIRDWLRGLQWDGTPRVDKWFIHVLGMTPDGLAPRPKYKRYLELVGRFLLMGLVARVIEPGCKFDYSPVLEGTTGRGKSTFVKTLVGLDYFSDTHFDLGSGNAGMEQLEGLWGYELSELTPLRRADSEQVKQFFSSTTDRFRGAYGKYVQSHPRQCVIFCSTNKKQYLYDLTGNRRFWPVWIDEFIKLAWLTKWREQLFAEAYALYMAGERYTPTPEEEDLYFVPEQRKRLVETAVQSRLYELLTREGASNGEGKLSVEINVHLTFVTLDRLVSALGADAAKSSSLLEAQIRGWLESQGWTYGREGGGTRRRGYKQPPVWPPEITDDEDESAPPRKGGPADDTAGPAQGQDHEGDDDEPF
jgi:predicted P-loop ATPase